VVRRYATDSDDALELAQRAMLHAFQAARRTLPRLDKLSGGEIRFRAWVQRVLDGRAQMAALDKELFAQLSVGQSPQKKAKLALFMAKFGEEMRRIKGAKGRHHRR